MVAKIKTYIYVEVSDKDQGEEACGTINSQLAAMMRGFPAGDVIGVDVDSFDEALQTELEELGFVE